MEANMQSWQSGQQLPPPPEPTPVIRYSRPRSTGATVAVACKLPGGLLLRIFAPFEYEDPQRDGSTKTVKSWRPIPGEQFALKGTWVATAGQAYQKTNSAVAELLPGGYAITYGVPRAIWDRWYEQNRNTPLVQKRIVFAASSLQQATVDAKTEESRKVKSGLEPVDPEDPARRMPGGVDRRLRMSMLTEGEGTTPR
jgi:hypothetical protein